MMNVLIADDESLARATLRSMLSDCNLDINILGEASDGEQLAQKAWSEQPDVVFVDIRMPKLNGLDSIKRVKKNCPNTKWIILTGFSEFEYAKEALNLGAEKYLLKPVSLEELKSTLKSIQNSRKNQQTKLNMEFEHDIIFLLNDLITLDDLNESNIIRNAHFIGEICTFDTSLEENRLAGIQHKFCNIAHRLMDQYVSASVRLAFFVTPNGNLATAFVWDPSVSPLGKEQADSYLKKLAQIAGNMNNSEYRLTILQSDECRNFNDFREQMNQMQNLAPLRIIMPADTRILLKNLLFQFQKAASWELEAIDDAIKIANCYKNGLYMEYIKSIDSLETLIERIKTGRDVSQKLTPIFRFLVFSCSLKSDLDSCRDWRFIIKVLRQNNRNAQGPGNRPNELVEKVISFIERNYMNDIGIAQIADQLNVTPNYLSSLFHRKTGENFIRYLTRVRLLKARKLLTFSSDAHVNQIAKQVGYYTVNYFTKLYKQYFGVCPSDDIGKNAGTNVQNPSQNG